MTHAEKFNSKSLLCVNVKCELMSVLDKSVF